MKLLITLGSLFISLAAFASPYPVVTEPPPFLGSRLIVPNDGASHTSVIMLHGSEGGSAPYLLGEASILATLGYRVLLLCYFDCGRGLNGPRQTLNGVEVNLVLEAVSWLRSRPSSNGKVVVYGFSRGAELTMITGSLLTTVANRPNALIAHSPSDVFVGPWNWDWREPSCWMCKAGVGKCPEGSSASDFEWNPRCGPDDPNKMDFKKSAWLSSGNSIPAGTRIEIERYVGPILITVGEKDDVWPVEQTKRIEATLRAAGANLEIHYFPEGGHSLRGVDEVTRRELVLDFLKRVP